MTEQEQRDFEALWIKRSLGTRALVEECIKLIPPDEAGRDTPAYLIVHRAVLAYRDKLLAETPAPPVVQVAPDATTASVHEGDLASHPSRRGESWDELLRSYNLTGIHDVPDNRRACRVCCTDGSEAEVSVVGYDETVGAYRVACTCDETKPCRHTKAVTQMATAEALCDPGNVRYS